LHDVFMPTEGYEQAATNIQAEIKLLERQKLEMERRRDESHTREYKALKKEIVKLQDFHTKLREESLQQSQNHKQVLARLEQEKDKWFMKPSPHATAAFVAEMICPRVLTSFADALFCCHFVRLLIKLKTPGFQLLDFYNNWTIMLTQCIRCCSEREAQIFGIFLREMMSYVLHLRKDEQTFNAEMKDNPCFHRNYYTPGEEVKEWAQFGDIKKGHGKWEGRIFKSMKAGLDSDEWMEKRNTLLMLSQSYEAFPTVERYARHTLQSVEAIQKNEEMSDLKTLANSLAVKLKGEKERWVDKAPVAKGEGQKAEEGSRKQTGSGPKSGLAPVGATLQSKDGERIVSIDRTDSDVREGERRGDGAVVIKDGKDGKERRDHKDHKDAKDKEKSKDRDHGEAKARDSKEARSGEKDSKRARPQETTEKSRTEKERSDGRGAEKASATSRGVAAEKDAGAGDRKRTTGDRGAERVVVHDDRGDKRRRTEREGGRTEDRGGGYTSHTSTSGRHGEQYRRR